MRNAMKFKGEERKSDFNVTEAQESSEILLCIGQNRKNEQTGWMVCKATSESFMWLKDLPKSCLTGEELAK